MSSKVVHVRDASVNTFDNTDNDADTSGGNSGDDTCNDADTSVGSNGNSGDDTVVCI